MPFRTKRSRLKQRFSVLYTSLVHVESSLNIVKRVCDYGLLTEEVICKYSLSGIADSLKSSYYVAFESRIHLNGSSCGCGTF